MTTIRVHPGEQLAEYLEVRGWSPEEFARRADLPLDAVEAILDQTAPVTREIACKFEDVLGMSAVIWLGLQSYWDTMQ